MNTAFVRALAAISGSLIGGMGPVLSSYVLQRSVTRREISNREINVRETLYAEFITEASRVYLTSVTHSTLR